MLCREHCPAGAGRLTAGCRQVSYPVVGRPAPLVPRHFDRGCVLPKNSLDISGKNAWVFLPSRRVGTFPAGEWASLPSPRAAMLVGFSNS